jgi:cbb3-type cytochrome oxidase subunit 3
MLYTLILIGLVFLAVVLPMLWRYRTQVRRQRTLARMLDLADEVERLLDRSQDRMGAMRPLVQRVPADIAAEAKASLDSTLPIREAKRDVLQHRLWIQQHGTSASQAELDRACGALARVSERLERQLAELERVGSDLASVTEAAAEAALREPPTLRRPGP